MNRRRLIQNSLKAALLLASGGLPQLVLPRPLWSAEEQVLAVRQGQDIPQLVRETVAALGGMGRFVHPGERVVVKPNIGWDRPPEMAANTHPLVVKTVIELVLEAGASEVKVFDRTCNDPRRCYVTSGMQEVLGGIHSDRFSFEHMDRRAYQPLAIEKGQALNRWSFYRPALEADRLINLPIAKHHSISTLTLGMKNLMGVIGGNRGMLHRKIPEALADINSVIHSDLTLIDATRILIANGPQGGRLEDVRVRNTLIASPQVATADAYASTLFGYQPQQIPSVVAGHQRGLGEMDLARVRRV